MPRLSTMCFLAACVFASAAVAAPPLGLISPTGNRQEEPEKKEAAGVIKGSVQKNGRALKNSLIRVEVVGLGEKFRKKVNADGTFEFTDVPAGTYVLKATGSFKNAEVSGELKDVKPGEAKTVEAVVVGVE